MQDHGLVAPQDRSSVVRQRHGLRHPRAPPVQYVHESEILWPTDMAIFLKGQVRVSNGDQGGVTGRLRAKDIRWYVLRSNFVDSL